jgi:hypothetical protein
VSYHNSLARSARTSYGRFRAIINKARRGLPSSAFFLIGANAVPLLGVLFGGWDLVEILFAYWAENVVIGFFSLLKMLSAPDDTRGLLIILTVFMKIIGCAFFIVHFGGFTAGHGVVLYAIFHEFLNLQIQPLELLYMGRYIVAALFLSHGYSFVVNYLIKGERNQIKGNDPMFEPYRRVIVMHLTLVFGTGCIIFLGQPFFMLLILVVLKTAVDLYAHLRERKRFARDLETRSGSVVVSG